MYLSVPCCLLTQLHVANRSIAARDELIASLHDLLAAPHTAEQGLPELLAEHEQQLDAERQKNIFLSAELAEAQASARQASSGSRQRSNSGPTDVQTNVAAQASSERGAASNAGVSVGAPRSTGSVTSGGGHIPARSTGPHLASGAAAELTGTRGVAMHAHHTASHQGGPAEVDVAQGLRTSQPWEALSPVLPRPQAQAEAAPPRPSRAPSASAAWGIQGADQGAGVHRATVAAGAGLSAAAAPAAQHARGVSEPPARTHKSGANWSLPVSAGTRLPIAGSGATASLAGNMSTSGAADMGAPTASGAPELSMEALDAALREEVASAVADIAARCSTVAASEGVLGALEDVLAGRRSVSDSLRGEGGEEVVALMQPQGVEMLRGYASAVSLALGEVSRMRDVMADDAGKEEDGAATKVGAGTGSTGRTSAMSASGAQSGQLRRGYVQQQQQQQQGGTNSVRRVGTGLQQRNETWRAAANRQLSGYEAQLQAAWKRIHAVIEGLVAWLQVQQQASQASAEQGGSPTNFGRTPQARTDGGANSTNSNSGTNQASPQSAHTLVVAATQTASQASTGSKLYSPAQTQTLAATTAEQATTPIIHRPPSLHIHVHTSPPQPAPALGVPLDRSTTLQPYQPQSQRTPSPVQGHATYTQHGVRVVVNTGGYKSPVSGPVPSNIVQGPPPVHTAVETATSQRNRVDEAEQRLAQRTRAHETAAAALARASAAARAAAAVGPAGTDNGGGAAIGADAAAYPAVFHNTLYNPDTAAASQEDRVAGGPYSGRWWMQGSEEDSDSDGEYDVHRSYQGRRSAPAPAADATTRARSTPPQRPHVHTTSVHSIQATQGSSVSASRRGLAFDIPITPLNTSHSHYHPQANTVAGQPTAFQQQQAAASGLREVHAKTGVIGRAAAHKWQVRQQQDAHTHELVQRAHDKGYMPSTALYRGDGAEPRVQVSRELRQLVGMAAESTADATAAAAADAGSIHGAVQGGSVARVAGGAAETWGDIALRETGRGRAALTGSNATRNRPRDKSTVPSLVQALGGSLLEQTGLSASARTQAAASAAAAASEARRFALDRLKLLRTSAPGASTSTSAVAGASLSGAGPRGSVRDAVDLSAVESEDVRVRAMARIADTVYSRARQV